MYMAPRLKETAFNCPRCNAYAHQTWMGLFGSSNESGVDVVKSGDDLSKVRHLIRIKEKAWVIPGLGDGTRKGDVQSLVSQCQRCDQFSYWIDKRLVYPKILTNPPPHGDMPYSVVGYYNEARQIAGDSPRAAAALLRLAAKKLCEELGETERNLNRAIGNLKKKGLSESVIQSLDSLRITGNEGGAHEGQIDLSGEDNKPLVEKLFWLLNFIVEKTIAEPRNIEETFHSMPEGQKQSVKARDENCQGS